MPVIVDPDSTTARRLLGALPPGCQSVDTTERLLPWLAQHPEEYVVVLGPNISFGDGVTVCEGLRTIAARHQRRVRPSGARHRSAGPGHAGRCPRGRRHGRPPPASPAPSRVPTRSPRPCAARRRREHNGHVISVFSPKGGVGKTTVAVNLALALTDKGARQVCLVDFDLAFGDVAITLQLFPSHTIEHAIGSEEDLDAPDAQLAADPLPGLPQGAGSAEPPRRPRADHRRCSSPRCCAPCARCTTTSSSTPRRPSTSRR